MAAEQKPGRIQLSWKKALGGLYKARVIKLEKQRIELLDQDIGCTFETDDRGQFTSCRYRDGQGIVQYHRT